MSVIRSFQALRPLEQNIAKIAAVPYDVVSREEATLMARDNPLSFLHISRSEVDLPDELNGYSDRIYQKSLANFEKMIQEGLIFKDEQSAYYIYRLQMGNHIQTGIAGCFSLDEYESNLIKKHERTRKDKEDDRTRHILNLNAQTGPIFLSYRGVEEIDQYVDQYTRQLQPLYHFAAQDGVIHTLWKMTELETIDQLFREKVSTLYIADGHHRAAAASRARTELAKKNLKHRGDENYNFFYGVVFPANQLRILPYHRVVKDLAGMTHNQFLERVESSFRIQIGDSSIPNQGEFGMYVGKKWYCITPREKKLPNQLDVALLQDMLLGPMLGIADPRTDKRIEFVGGIRGIQELERIVNRGDAVVAFSVHPVSLDEMMDVVDRGEIMPPKSTWFEPKLCDGVLCHQF